MEEQAARWGGRGVCHILTQERRPRPCRAGRAHCAAGLGFGGQRGRHQLSPVAINSVGKPGLCCCSVVSESLRPHGLQHARLPRPSLPPGVCSNSCPLSRRCHPTISYWGSDKGLLPGLLALPSISPIFPVHGSWCGHCRVQLHPCSHLLQGSQCPQDKACTANSSRVCPHPATTLAFTCK